jgi:hypothetical protein
MRRSLAIATYHSGASGSSSAEVSTSTSGSASEKSTIEYPTNGAWPNIRTSENTSEISS